MQVWQMQYGYYAIVNCQEYFGRLIGEISDLCHR